MTAHDVDLELPDVWDDDGRFLQDSRSDIRLRAGDTLSVNGQEVQVTNVELGDPSNLVTVEHT